jgi:hypothetical protein
VEQGRGSARGGLMDFATADQPTLERMLRDPRFGEPVRDRIRARLAMLEDAPAATAPTKGAGKLRGVPNKTELRFLGDVLEPMVAAGELVRVEYEAITFHVHGVARYTPDFVGWLPDGRIHCFEVKGAHVREQDRVRWKAHSRARPWVWWSLHQWREGKWKTLYDRHPE